MSSLDNILNPQSTRPVRIPVIPPEQASSTWVPPSAHHRSPGSVSDDDRDDYDPLSHMAHPDCPDSLSCLPDTDGRPQHTLPVILRCAILGSPRKGLTIREIYAAMEEKYAYYRTAGPSWKQSVRHLLSLNRLFERKPRAGSDPGFGSYWTVNLLAPPGTKRPRKRGQPNKKKKDDGPPEAGTSSSRLEEVSPSATRPDGPSSRMEAGPSSRTMEEVTLSRRRAEPLSPTQPRKRPRVEVSPEPVADSTLSNLPPPAIEPIANDSPAAGPSVDPEPIGQGDDDDVDMLPYEDQDDDEIDELVDELESDSSPQEQEADERGSEDEEEGQLPHRRRSLSRGLAPENSLPAFNFPPPQLPPDYSAPRTAPRRTHSPNSASPRQIAPPHQMTPPQLFTPPPQRIRTPSIPPPLPPPQLLESPQRIITTPYQPASASGPAHLASPHQNHNTSPRQTHDASPRPNTTPTARLLSSPHQPTAAVPRLLASPARRSPLHAAPTSRQFSPAESAHSAHSSYSHQSYAHSAHSHSHSGHQGADDIVERLQMEMASLRRHSAEEIARLSDRLARAEGEVHERRQEVGMLEGRLRDERERRRRAEEALSVRGGGRAER